MIKTKIFEEGEHGLGALEKEVNHFCQQVVTKGSLYAKVFDIDWFARDSDIFAAVTYDDGESERTAT